MKTLKTAQLLISGTLLLTGVLKSQSDPGNLPCVECPTTASEPCMPLASLWALGGNNILAISPGSFGAPVIPPSTDVGTCNDFPFILKANNKKSVYILPNSYVGVGYLNSSPIAALDIRDGSQATSSNFRIYGDAAGNLESTTDIKMSFATGKSFAINEGSVNGSTSRLFMQNGKLGLNNITPVCDLDISNPSTAEVRINSQSNANANVWTSNSITAYNFGVDNSGTGHIGASYSSPVKLINFMYNGSISKPQVWIGKRPTTGNHTDFSLAVDGKVVANSLYVTLQGNWADFVFDSNYDLMPLSAVEDYYKSNQHLPGVPSTEEVKKEGLNLEEMNTVLLKKVEELTLYLVQQQKEINALKNK